MLYGELCSKKESIRVEKFLKTKDRLGEDLGLKYDDVSRKEKIITVVALILISAGLSLNPDPNTTQIVLTVIGAFTSPLIMFSLPGYLYYDYARKNDMETYNKRLSLVLMIIGILLMISMTTLSLVTLRAHTTKQPQPKTLIPAFYEL